MWGNSVPICLRRCRSHPPLDPLPEREGKYLPASRGCRTARARRRTRYRARRNRGSARSEEHTSELQSLMRISYAVFCLKKKKTTDQYVKHERKSVHTTHEEN